MSPLSPRTAAASTPVRGAGRLLGERVIETGLMLAGISSILITVGIVFILVSESVPFFRHVSVMRFLTESAWTPLFDPPSFGIRPLVAATLITTAIALLD